MQELRLDDSGDEEMEWETTRAHAPRNADREKLQNFVVLGSQFFASSKDETQLLIYVVDKKEHKMLRVLTVSFASQEHNKIKKISLRHACNSKSEEKCQDTLGDASDILICRDGWDWDRKIEDDKIDFSRFDVCYDACDVPESIWKTYILRDLVKILKQTQLGKPKGGRGAIANTSNNSKTNRLGILVAVVLFSAAAGLAVSRYLLGRKRNQGK